MKRDLIIASVRAGDSWVTLFREAEHLYICRTHLQVKAGEWPGSMYAIPAEVVPGLLAMGEQFEREEDA